MNPHKIQILLTTDYDFRKMIEGSLPVLCRFFLLNCNPFLTYYICLNTLKNKASGKHCGKGEIAQNEQFHLFPQCFLCNLYLKNPLTYSHTMTPFDTSEKEAF